jgi:hypothetical protein
MRSSSWIHTLLLSVLVTLPVSAHAAEKTTSTPEIRLQNLTLLPNRAVSAFFASGRGATFATDSGIPVIRTIKAGPVRSEVASDGTAVIGSETIPSEGFEILNYLVIIVHPSSQQEVKIRNADGSIPTPTGIADGPVPNSPAFDNDRVIYLKVKLSPSRDSILQIGNVNTNSGKPIVLNMENS